MATPPLAKLVVADASRLHAEALALVLSGRGYRVQATASTCGGLLRAVTACHPDTCIVDLQLLDGRALDVITQIRVREPQTKIIVLSREMDPGSVAAATKAGVVGYLGKDKSFDLLDRALRTVESGDRFIEPTLAPQAQRRVDERQAGDQALRWLTQREREVLRRLTEGDDTTEIARGLRMTTNTARTHVQNVLDKLGVHSRLEAVALAHQAGVERTEVHQAGGAWSGLD
ncbi:two-component system nitrate/nitrite response regulator NarL [Kitasatospora sp. MAP12-15]|uniref:response regulator transcription factor n=1 Tax=unclassified Kitasatospora TaxID=2633591 RepID=UPI002472FA0C|nr:response regulator transcription factor [Kitasatospora sp. MAP12-44]MDH6108514.1 two-component system nitrate/nitrite response regulator NarL [Kitasatospora sp. MAP12-44]